ncbi:MAG TPA: UbiA family prenyltransferase [Desulfotignum sp.]|nr:UbiA family prenyltransferase [Desulfotignum sp.]
MMNGNPAMAVSARLVHPAGRVRIFTELTKAHLTFYIALSAVFGHVISTPEPEGDTLVLGAAVWLLASGAAVVNNIQDRRYDACFVRTWRRSLPQKKVTASTAGVIAAGLVLSGLGMLFLCFHKPLPLVLGFLSLVCYNGLYTPLKKKSCLAVLPGVVCGMLPPAIGWTAGSMTPYHTGFHTLLVLMLVTGIWQVPHFMVLASRHTPVCPDPVPFFTPPDLWTTAERNLQILIWTSLYSLAVFLFIITGGIAGYAFSAALAGMALVLPVGMAAFFKRCPGSKTVPIFYAVNLSMLFFMALGILDQLLV